MDRADPDPCGEPPTTCDSGFPYDLRHREKMETFSFDLLADATITKTKEVRTMKDEMSRRDFLKTAVGAGAVLMAGGILDATKNAYRACWSREVMR